MDALYLTPGSQANVWFTYPQQGQYTVDSSNPAVAAVPSTTTVPAAGASTFAAHALSTGTATIRVLSGTFVAASFYIDVIPAGTTRRWPGAISASVNSNEMGFPGPAIFTMENHGTAPYSGATATGVVTFSAKGRELSRITLGPKSQRLTVPVFAAETGPQQFDMSYEGDANFLPSTTSFTMIVTRSAATISASAQRSGTGANVHVRVIGSRMVTPAGTINVSEHGTHQTSASLTTTAPGVAEADVTMSGIGSGPHTFTVVYSGDTNYTSGMQDAPLLDGRGRAVRH
jgi:hypothetical protein